MKLYLCHISRQSMQKQAEKQVRISVIDFNLFDMTASAMYHVFDLRCINYHDFQHYFAYYKDLKTLYEKFNIVVKP